MMNLYLSASYVLIMMTLIVALIINLFHNYGCTAIVRGLKRDVDDLQKALKMQLDRLKEEQPVPETQLVETVPEKAPSGLPRTPEIMVTPEDLSQRMIREYKGNPDDALLTEMEEFLKKWKKQEEPIIQERKSSASTKTIMDGQVTKEGLDLIYRKVTTYKVPEMTFKTTQEAVDYGVKALISDPDCQDLQGLKVLMINLLNKIKELSDGNSPA